MDVPPQAQHRVVRSRYAGVTVLGLEVQKADGEGTRLSRDASPSQDVVVDADAAAEEDVGRSIVAELEELGTLQEELPFFRIEEAEAAQVDLDVVHFHLGEVGVVGQVQGEARCEAVLHVQA